MRPTKYLLDSGILIFALRSDLRAFRLITYLTARGVIATSAINAFEVLRGCRSGKQLTSTEHLLSRTEIVPLGIRASRHAAQIALAHPGVFGNTNTVPDALIAGCAVDGGGAVVTLNGRQFRDLRYPGLEVIMVEQDAVDWTAGIL